MRSIRELKGSRWTGKTELWLDPFGNDAALSDCTITVGEGAVSYTWSHDETSTKERWLCVTAVLTSPTLFTLRNV